MSNLIPEGTYKIQAAGAKLCVVKGEPKIRVLFKIKDFNNNMFPAYEWTNPLEGKYAEQTFSALRKLKWAGVDIATAEKDVLNQSTTVEIVHMRKKDGTGDPFIALRNFGGGDFEEMDAKTMARINGALGSQSQTSMGADDDIPF